jgi:nanoRNase/pAp phosphatase (c-di-AMP/oligoRNAs hydrolase)
MADPAQAARGLGALAAVLDRDRPVFVQTHDFPDLDAVASAWALADLLSRRGFTTHCLYRGRIRSRSLGRLVRELCHSLSDHVPETLSATPGGEAQLVVVDGSPSNGNVSLFPGLLAGVIDHHCTNSLPLSPYIDVRPELASCSTIIAGYFKEAGIAIPRDIATALIAGIQSDTDFLSRRAAPEDFAAYAELFAQGDFDTASRIVRTVFDLADLALVSSALAASSVSDGIFWACLEGDCAQEVLAVLAEFVLRTEEIRAAIVIERGPALSIPPPSALAGEPNDDAGVHLSVRSKDPQLSAFDLVRRALEGLGSGGGHSHSAGGYIPGTSYPGDGVLRDRFFAAAREISS